MLLTRSIQRKLWFGVILAGVTVLIAGGSSVLGLRSYHRMVEDLALSITDLPRKSDLIATISGLARTVPLELSDSHDPVEQQELARQQSSHFLSVVVQVRADVSNFQHSLQKLPSQLSPNSQQEAAYSALLVTIDRNLADLERQAGGLTKLELPRELTKQRQLSRDMQRAIRKLLENAEQAPDPSSRLIVLSQKARQDYETHFRWVVISSLVSGCLLIGLGLWGYQLIVSPMKALLKGVRQIARGDYGYRLHIDTGCELSQLANSFNEMARRIEEDGLSKEREIEERSRQLVNTERLAGAGFLASGVAHEINNPLSVIMNAAYGLETMLSDEALSGLNEIDRHDVRDYLKMIQSESERCERITKKLLDFSYGKGDERHRYDITAIVNEVVSMTSHLSRYQDRRVSVNREDPLHAWVNAPEIKQVVLNLLANALDATQSGGHVDIKLRDCSDKVEITVTDDGIGMTPEQKARLFDPFYTTKEVGKGTGLGLSITSRIVRDHGGTLEANSPGPGQGATFRLSLPKSPARANAA